MQLLKNMRHMHRAGMAIAVIILGSLQWAPDIAVGKALHAEKKAPVDAAWRDGYAGDAACAGCHKDQVASYSHTAHYSTSAIAGSNSIAGSLRNESNVLMIVRPETTSENPGLFFKMEARNDGAYQTAVAGWPGQYQTKTARMDIVVGSGVRGQSYLSWQGDELYELPVSYWTDGHQWINSPGYKDGSMDFSRAVVPRCLECHSTYIHQLSANPLSNRYDKASLVVGITCEKCHGPGKAHIALESAAKPSAAPAAGVGILNPAKFPRDRQVDLCALCHNGLRGEELAPAFSFVAGQSLDKYLQPNSGEIAEKPSVHGNQVGLLKKSRCYLSSPGMSCSTCHDIHAPEKEAASYSSRCLTCHLASSCGMFKTGGVKIAENCVDCHMPVEQTDAVVSETVGRAIQPKMRSHWIRVYR
ncbi:multiheme c-type cytochrome [Paracidobacterium acidisoli]|nr:multiheme c-type cytochrome [Paracidobacterium acidisoli]MBT9332376.1 hypothetical protein [Paracidobacterium acidisoli]